MIYAIALGLVALAVICRKLGNSWLFPPAVYAMYWAAILLASTVISFSGYSLTIDSQAVFLAGCICTAMGGLVALALFARRKLSSRRLTERRKNFIQIAIVVYSIGLLALIPAYVAAVQQAGLILGVADFSVAARLALGQPDRVGISHYFQELTSVASVLAYYAAWLYSGSRRDKVMLVLAVFAPLVMSSLTFARSPVYALLIGVLAILTFRKKISRLMLITAILFTLVLALGLGASLDKGPNLEASGSPITAIVDNLAIYYVGGPVGFGQVMDDPAKVGEAGLSLRFFTQTGQSLGADIELPNNVLGYVSSDLGNVYTTYFAYWLDWRWPGVIVFSLLLGFVSSTVYILARRGNGIAGAALALIVGSLLNSAVGDGLFGSAIPWLLIIGIGWGIYYLPLPKVLLFKRSEHLSAAPIRHLRGSE